MGMTRWRCFHERLPLIIILLPYTISLTGHGKLSPKLSKQTCPSMCERFNDSAVKGDIVLIIGVEETEKLRHLCCDGNKKCI